MNKRRGVTTAVAKRRPVIHVLPDETAIRVVCHASVIGGIIGPNGSVVSKLRRETGTKIHCESPVNGSDHWVVFIVGSTAVNKSVLLTDRVGDFSGGEHEDWVTCEVSAAQSALIRVLERSWVVLAAKDSGGVVDGEDEEACCGILADRNQIGAVLGLGGKNVEWIRRQSGAMIRVLPPPICGTNTDELIQITGDVLAVKKALVMVSTCIQNCPPLNGYPPPLCSKAYESSSTDVNSDDPHSEFFPNLHSSLPNVSETAEGDRHLPSLYEEEGDRFQDSENTERKVVFKMIYTSVVVGGIIGKQGSIVRALQNQSGASILVGAPLKVSGERVVTISARENLESRYSHAQNALALVFARSVEIDVEKGRRPGLHNGPLVKAKLLVPSQFANSLIENRNREAIVATGAHVHIPVGDQISEGISEIEVVIEICGEYSHVQKTLTQVSSKLRENLLPKKVHGEMRARVSKSYESAGTNHIHNLQPSQQIASRGDSLSVSDGEQDLKMVRSSAGVMKPVDSLKHTKVLKVVDDLTQGMKQLQVSSNGDVYDSQPRSKGVSLRKLTLELLVEKDALGSLYGRDGTGLDNLSQISGAKVDVKDPKGVEATVLISGNPEQTRTAMSLIDSILADQ
ncbi:PREDICTED: KH domain-containing protein HEN4-like isoform X2 [Camelina sativa]|uniref:KH domain-containing protein HEN4-like isoform X2 n=1 Tax=Camelina sativa TaxID=90675 RepID=A0ABM0WK58_CAMSA|nr:PREDICTED: KH domain-containing protein HEN4-like isoform X2 [Camelina sativa]